MGDPIFGFVLLWAGLVVLLTGGGRWLQAAFYSEPAAGFAWRGPLAGTLLALFLGLWGYLDAHPPGRFASIFAFSAHDDREYPRLRAVIRRDGHDVTVAYRVRRNERGVPEYREETRPDRPMPRGPEAVIVDDDGQDARFEPDRATPAGQPLRYIDSRGRVMRENTIGRVSTFFPARLAAYAALNVCHFFLWFGCLWALLHFQWAHALGLAAVAWLAMTLLIVPMWLGKVEESAGRPTQARGAAPTVVTYSPGCA